VLADSANDVVFIGRGHSIFGEVGKLYDDRQVLRKDGLRLEVGERLVDRADRWQSFVLPLDCGKDLIGNDDSVF